MAYSPSVKLNNGTFMPRLGLGVWQDSDSEAEMAVATALQEGYRLIDTAAVYGNEAGVGRAIAESSVARSQIFVTTKLWNADHGREKTMLAFERSMERLKLDYINLYLMHWPMPATNTYVETWSAMEDIYASGRVKAIGVSNFLPEHLETLLKKAIIVPAVNQIELHPWLQQIETRAFCAQHGIRVESYSPLGGTDGALLDDPLLAAISEKHGKTSAQIVLRWHIQNKFIVIPKSVHASRIRENIAVFDFELDEEDMEAIAAMNRNERVGANPATANFV